MQPVPKSPNRPTIHDVARVAGVSKSTVSRVLNERGYASPETVARVQSAIDELSYIPHASARGLVSQQTRTLGLAVNDLTTLFIPPLLAGIEAMARAAGYNLLISAVGHLAEENSNAPLGVHNTDGIIAFADSFSDQQLVRFYEKNFPVVLLHRKSPVGTEFPSINVENEEATRCLVNHLIQEHGRRRIVCLRGPMDQQDSIERENGYRLALQDHQISYDPALIAAGDFNSGVAEAAIRQLIAAQVRFDAVFAGDDEAAVGAIRELKNFNLRVPEDVAVVGFDDDYRAADIDPPLTTVQVPFDEMGREAVSALMAYIQSGEPTTKLLPTQPIVRKSCGC